MLYISPILLLESLWKILFLLKAYHKSELTVFNCLQLLLVLLVSDSSKYQLVFFAWSLTVFVYFLKTFPKGEQVCLVCFVICSWLEGNISSTVRYLYLSILPDNKADIFETSLLIWSCSFSPLIWSSIVMIYYIFITKDFFYI